MLRKWVDNMAEGTIDERVAFAVFVFHRLGCVRPYYDFREVCQRPSPVYHWKTMVYLYLDWDKAAEKILRRAKAVPHKVDGQEVLEKLSKRVDRAMLIMLFHEESDVAKQRHNELITELTAVREIIHA